MSRSGQLAPARLPLLSRPRWLTLKEMLYFTFLTCTWAGGAPGTEGLVVFQCVPGCGRVHQVFVKISFVQIYKNYLSLQDPVWRFCDCSQLQAACSLSWHWRKSCWSVFLTSSFSFMPHLSSNPYFFFYRRGFIEKGLHWDRECYPVRNYRTQWLVLNMSDRLNKSWYCFVKYVKPCF